MLSNSLRLATYVAGTYVLMYVRKLCPPPIEWKSFSFLVRRGSWLPAVALRFPESGALGRRRVYIYVS